MTTTMTMTTRPEQGADEASTDEASTGSESGNFGVVLPDGRQAAEVPMERLEADMLGLAGQLAAGTCAFLTMVGEYDARRGWASWEALSCAHWLNWRCGVGIVAAREQVRVARRLRELPVIHAHFSRGELSYSKVRAITRVAHAGNEADLVVLARAGTAAQVERACAALRRCADNRAAEQALQDGEQLAHLRRSLSWHHDDSGDLVIRARIPAGRSAEGFLAAIKNATAAAAAEQGDTTGNGSGDLTDDSPDDTAGELECRRLDALLDLVSAGSQVDSSLAPQPEVVVHVTIPAHVQHAGLHASDLQWPIRTAAEQQLSAATLQELCCDTGIRWTADLLPDPAPWGSASDVGASVSSLMASFDLGRHRRFPDRRLRRSVQRRDGGTCRFPGCGRRHRLHIHHIVFWEHGGRTDHMNLLSLCPKHHRAVHLGDWSLTGSADHPEFRRSDQLVTATAPPVQGRLADLVEDHRRHGLDIAADGAGSLWAGDHIDWDCFFAGFIPHDPDR